MCKRWMLFALATGCGPAPRELAGDPQMARVGPADPGFPAGFTRWVAAEPVRDDAAGEVRRFFRSPEAVPDRRGALPAGAVLVKAHCDPADAAVVTRVDVRRRDPAAPGGWTYESFDPVTRTRLPADVETCALCHDAAPRDGTYITFESSRRR